MIDTVASQNIDLPSWDILYNKLFTSGFVMKVLHCAYKTQYVLGAGSAARNYAARPFYQR
jgi:hypothetical protein